jgi:hypothetical protein
MPMNSGSNSGLGSIPVPWINKNIASSLDKFLAGPFHRLEVALTAPAGSPAERGQGAKTFTLKTQFQYERRTHNFRASDRFGGKLYKPVTQARV